MTTNTPGPMSEVYRRLSAIGLSRPFVKDVILPDWWEDEIAEKPAGLNLALAYLSRFAGVDMDSMLEVSGPVQFRRLADCRFKRSKGTEVADLDLSRAFATQLGV